MALVALDSYVPRPLIGVQAMLDEDGSNMVELYNWVMSLGLPNTAVFNADMYVLSIFTTKDGIEHMFNYQPGYYLVLTSANELTQISQNTFEILYQSSS